MAVFEREFDQAEARMATLRQAGFAVSVRYERRMSRVVVTLNTGVQVAFPTRLAEGLAGASADDLAEIEISPTGLGLHWPRLDADVYVPALLQGVLGSKRRMAAQLGAAGDRARRRRDKRTGRSIPLLTLTPAPRRTGLRRSARADRASARRRYPPDGRRRRGAR